jgi:hypothetical protein
MEPLLPRGKDDVARAQAVIAAGFPQIAACLSTLIEWMQDCNWPVAITLSPFLASTGAPLAPHVRLVLKSNDDCWKYSIVHRIVAESPELARLLEPELRRIIGSPTPGELAEGVDVVAAAALARSHLHPPGAS